MTFTLRDVNAPSSNILGTAGATILHGTTSATVDTPSTSESDLKVTEIIDVRPELRIKVNHQIEHLKDGTGEYNPNDDFDYPIPAIPIRASEVRGKTEIGQGY